MYYLENFCFLCLSPSISTTSHNIDVEEKLEYLLSTYQVLQLSKIPKQFCDNCLENLNSFYDFKHKCVKSIVISSYYVQKLSQESSTYARLSVRLSDILHNAESDTVNSIDNALKCIHQELNDEIFEIDNYEQHETVEVEQDKANEEQVSIDNERDYIEVKREITEELIIKEENSDDNDDIFECKTCKWTFRTEILLTEHTVWCKKKKRPIEAVNQIQNDIESVHIDESTIDTCNHIVAVPYACDICKKTFSHKGSLNQHKRIHTSKKQYKCDVCKKIFSKISNLIAHKRLHTGEKLYKCDICEKVFRQNSHLIVHKRVHTGEKLYECDVCKKLFSQNAHLIAHKRVHTGEKPYTCDICRKKFCNNITLNQHKLIHTGEKPYKCDVCEKVFRHVNCLNRHKRLHTGEKPYTCDVCRKPFRAKDSLNKHKLIHTGEKPYKCDVCERKFRFGNCLIRHKRVHTEKKLYQCDVCKRTFIRKHHFKKHQSSDSCK